MLTMDAHGNMVKTRRADLPELHIGMGGGAFDVRAKLVESKRGKVIFEVSAPAPSTSAQAVLYARGTVRGELVAGAPSALPLCDTRVHAPVRSQLACACLRFSLGSRSSSLLLLLDTSRSASGPSLRARRPRPRSAASCDGCERVRVSRSCAVVCIRWLRRRPVEARTASRYGGVG